HGLHGTGLEHVAASATDFRLAIVRMNVSFHKRAQKVSANRALASGNFAMTLMLSPPTLHSFSPHLHWRHATARRGSGHDSPQRDSFSPGVASALHFRAALSPDARRRVGFKPDVLRGDAEARSHAGNPLPD